MRFFLKFCLAIIVIIMAIVVSLFDISQHSLNHKTLTPNQVAAAKQTLARFTRELKNTDEQLSLSISQGELDVLADLAGHTFKDTFFEFYISNYNFTFAFSHNVSQALNIFANNNIKLNAYCVMGEFPDDNESALDKGSNSQFKIDYCKVGMWKLPGSLAEKIISLGFEKSMSKEASDMIFFLVGKIQLENQNLIVKTSRPPLLFKQVKQSVKDISKNATNLSEMASFNPTKFVSYIMLLSQHEQRDKPFAYYVGLVFQKSYQTTEQNPQNNPIVENRHALWALATYFGNAKFAKIIGVNAADAYRSSYTPTIKQRADLTLHFLYSAILEQIGGADIGLNIGELKELSDANEGGSGYSFADLAADKAGLKFSQVLVHDRASAKQAQLLLAGIKEEFLFFPEIEALPENLSAPVFERDLGDIKSERYNKLAKEIDRRIAELPLYQ